MVQWIEISDGKSKHGSYIQVTNSFCLWDNFATPSSKDMSKTSLHSRARGFGIESYNTDGMNFKNLNNKTTIWLTKLEKDYWFLSNFKRIGIHFASEMPSRMIILTSKLKWKC